MVNSSKHDLNSIGSKLDQLIEVVSTQGKDIKSIKSELKSQGNTLSNVQTDLSKVQTDLSKVQTDLSNVQTDLSNVQTDLSKVQTEVKSQGGLIENIRVVVNLHQKWFESWDQKFFEFRSQIHTLIDLGFSSKAKAHDDEIGILNVRTTELRDNVDRLNKFVFHQ